MKRVVFNLTAATLAGMFAFSPALAGDYNSGVVTKAPTSDYTDVEFGSGWYLRGDITYNVGGRSNTTVTNLAAAGGTVQVDYDDAIGARAGFGYYMNPQTRIELSAEGLFDSQFGGFSSATFAATDLANNPTTAAGTRQVEGNYNASNFAVNGYFDLARIGAFTPYVGAGVGIGRISLNQTETLVCSPIVGVSCDFPAGGSGAEVSLTRSTNDEFWTYTYQFSVGTAIAVDDKMSIDVGYSYTQFGDGDELNYSDGSAVDNDGFGIHQVRAGVRYDIW